MLPFTKTQLEEIRESHIEIIWQAHQDQAENNPEEFNEYITKMSTAHTLATMLLIEKDREQRDENNEELN